GWGIRGGGRYFPDPRSKLSSGGTFLSIPVPAEKKFSDFGAPNG
ncbi:hypothetical protein A2U01_0106496, partial [Trifolium medium]|nr:hypothetical protein [Trifolium medium]